MRRVRLLVTERIKTAANRFGLSRLHKRRPVQQPDVSTDLQTLYTPTESQRVDPLPERALKQIIAPYPNLSSFLFGGHNHWLGGNKKTQGSRKSLQDIITRPEFRPKDIENVDFIKLDEKLSSNDIEAPWVRDKADWKSASVTIGVPPLRRFSQASRRETAAAGQRLSRTEGIPNTPAEQPIQGEPLTIPGLWYKDICTEIRNTFEHDAATKHFVFDPYVLLYSRPGRNDPPEPVYSELFNSQAVVDEDIRIQNLPPRTMVMMMWWSDVTHVTQFGNSKVWPGYVYYGNQSKYERSRPTCHAAHHMVYFPSVSLDLTLSFTRH